MIVFPVGASGQRLIFSDNVLDHFDRHRQIRFWHREAGGLLFARLAPTQVEVVTATGPRLTDRRCRFGYRPDRAAEQWEINEYHARGLHFIGGWHTHPELHPTPSSLDRESMHEAVQKSRHRLNAFVLAIVGQAVFPSGLHVSLFDTRAHYVLMSNGE